MTADTERRVDAQEWVASVTEAVGQGYDYLDLIAGVDRVTHVEVVVRLVRSGAIAAGALRLVTAVPPTDARLPSLTGVLPAAAWHERELAEMFGIGIAEHAGPRPLLRRQSVGAPPMLRSTVLAARHARPWPGSADDSSGRGGPRRRQAPPGVAAGWVVQR